MNVATVYISRPYVLEYIKYYFKKYDQFCILDRNSIQGKYIFSRLDKNELPVKQSGNINFLISDTHEHEVISTFYYFDKFHQLQINDYFNQEFNQMFFIHMDKCRDSKIELKYGMKLFRYMYELTEDCISYEALKKKYLRYRQNIKKTLKEINQSFNNQHNKKFFRTLSPEQGKNFKFMY